MSVGNVTEQQFDPLLKNDFHFIGAGSGENLAHTEAGVINQISGFYPGFDVVGDGAGLIGRCHHVCPLGLDTGFARLRRGAWGGAAGLWSGCAAMVMDTATDVALNPGDAVADHGNNGVVGSFFALAAA